MATESAHLRGARVVVRPWRVDDVDLVVEAGRDPVIPLMTTVPPHGDVAAARAFVARQHRRVADGEGYSFVVADADTDVAVGHVGLWPTRSGTAGVGYWIAGSRRGQGFAADAVRAVTAWGVDALGLARIEVLVEPDNAASLGAARAAGFRAEGLARGAVVVGGERRDAMVLARLSTDADHPAADRPALDVPLLVVPPADATDPLVLLTGVLDELRDTVLRTLHGLSDTQLCTAHAPVTWSPLGLVAHLTAVERRWVRWGFRGEALDDPYPVDEWIPGPDVAAVLGAFRAETARSRATVATAAFTTPARPGGRFPTTTPSLGRILAHLIQEYARHVGQLDVVREAIDGTTGE